MFSALYGSEIANPFVSKSIIYHCCEGEANNWHVMMRDHRDIIIKRDNVDTHHVVALTNALYHVRRNQRHPS